ncbi:Fibrinogen-related domains (FReDs) [Halocaridina rubra]|uniref:Fibrinogen-related domains (FReDs) n=1 Tax=Halocaridina rubra TaxID=373956 RepID=A0AAN8WGS9_HALRR
MKEWQATYQAIVDDPQAKAFYRDCSAILWINPQNQSGVYSIFPTRDIKREVQVWCDMTASSDKGGSVGGWTVILRRRNSTSELLNFNRTWSEYRDGFGVPDDTGEWWFGLKWLHMLTYQEPYEILFQMHDIERGYFLAHYSTFRVEDESNQFRLIVDGFSGNVSDAFKDKHHGMPFSTLDRDNDMCESCNCATNNGGGWWYNVCHWTVLTSMYPTSNDRTAKTIRWLSGTWLVLDDVTVMIRPNSFSP